jgi:TatD DNase family protein
MKFIDIHSHLQLSDFENDREDIILKMKEKKVGTIIVGTDLESSKKAINISKQNKNIFATVGLHPNDNLEEDFSFEEYEKLTREKKVVAVGECGLDYFSRNLSEEISEEEKNRQKKIFEAHINLAEEKNLPLMIHVRDSIKKNKFKKSAHEDVIEILKSKKNIYKNNLRGNIHFFSGSREEAKKYFDLGFTISFTGVITFTKDYDEVIKNSPIEMIMAETDSPFVSPIPFRGKRNEPTNVIEVVKKIAEIKSEDFEKIRKKILENSKRVFSIVD